MLCPVELVTMVTDVLSGGRSGQIALGVVMKQEVGWPQYMYASFRNQRSKIKLKSCLTEHNEHCYINLQLGW